MKILPEWYTFQVEVGPFFNYYIQHGNTEVYFPAMMYIEECCSAELDKLSSDENFALSNNSNDFFNPSFSLKTRVIRYLADYSNKRIEKHVHHFA